MTLASSTAAPTNQTDRGYLQFWTRTCENSQARLNLNLKPVGPGPARVREAGPTRDAVH